MSAVAHASGGYGRHEVIYTCKSKNSGGTSCVKIGRFAFGRHHCRTVIGQYPFVNLSGHSGLMAVLGISDGTHKPA